MPIIRTCTPSDERSWLRCRTLSFLETSYYDDVWQSKPDAPVSLVAVEGDEVVGVLDIEIDDTLATIETVAVHPDHQGRGTATRLVEAALPLLPEGVTTLDAWTRDDEAANGWYRSLGMSESEHYLHVYLGWQDDSDGFTSPEGLSAPVMAFCHAPLAHEVEMRARFRRVHVCRRFSRSLQR